MEIMHKKFFFIILVFFIYLTGCQSIKDGLEGNKKTKSSEEFLIQKKNPLVLPPDYSKLPLPKNVSQEELKAKNTTRKRSPMGASFNILSNPLGT